MEVVIKRRLRSSHIEPIKDLIINCFNSSARKVLDSIPNTQKDFSLFYPTVKNILNKHVPLKQKYIRANDAPVMSNNLKGIAHVRD